MNQTLVHLDGKIQAFTGIDIKSLIDEKTLARIKAKDPHPFFQAYSIAHEGVSSPKILGHKSKPIEWSRKAIQSIKNVITKGIKFFFRHNKDNSTTDRRELGEIVADTQQEIDGKLHHIVVGYHPKEVKEEVKKYDICSQEGIWNLFDSVKKIVAGTIDKLTGIALSSSKIEQPAFSGARRLGMLQAFDDEQSQEKQVIEQTNGEPRKGVRRMTIKELMREIEDRNIFPSQLYTEKDLRQDRNFTAIFDKADSVEELQSKLTENEKALAEALETSTKLTKEQESLTAKQRLNDLLSNQELSDKTKAYVTNKFKGNLEDLSDEGLTKFIDQKVKDYEEDTKFFNFQEPNIDEPPKGNAIPPQTGGDPTKAENNPYLDGDLVTD